MSDRTVERISDITAVRYTHLLHQSKKSLRIVTDYFNAGTDNTRLIDGG